MFRRPSGVLIGKFAAVKASGKPVVIAQSQYGTRRVDAASS